MTEPERLPYPGMTPRFRPWQVLLAVALVGTVVGGVAWYRAARPFGYAMPSDDPRCPSGMAYIPAGTVLVRPWSEIASQPPSQGTDLAKVQEESVNLAGYCMDRTEVTASAYRDCVRAGVCFSVRDHFNACVASGECSGPLTLGPIHLEHEELLEHPVNFVTIGDAEAYCAWRGKRLPSYVEWQYAAQGGEAKSSFSWGTEVPDEISHHCLDLRHKTIRYTCPVRANPPGAFGLFGMSDNAPEYVVSPHCVGRLNCASGEGFAVQDARRLANRVEELYATSRVYSPLVFASDAEGSFRCVSASR